jgi:precorrin-4 methylase
MGRIVNKASLLAVLMPGVSAAAAAAAAVSRDQVL